MTQDLNKILADRGSDYGDFFGHAAVAQNIKGIVNAQLARNPQFQLLSPAEKHVVREGLDMIAHKIARIANGNPRVEDSWDDIGGYARITRERVCKKVEK